MKKFKCEKESGWPAEIQIKHTMKIECANEFREEKIIRGGHSESESESDKGMIKGATSSSNLKNSEYSFSKFETCWMWLILMDSL